MNNILYSLTKTFLKKNKKFYNIHKGESCYIFGNGSSLKYFDLKNFNDKISIGCNLLLSHNQAKNINLKYFYNGHPFFFYPYWFNPYYKKIMYNKLGYIIRNNIKKNSNINFFLSLSNLLGISGDNIYYLHHYGKKFENLKDFNLAKKFTFQDGSLSAMIGIALCLGFEDIILVGCDYTFHPSRHLHFYEYGNVPDSPLSNPYAEKFLLFSKKFCNIKTLVIDERYKGKILPSITYNKLTNDKPFYRENYELVDNDLLLNLNKVGMKYKIFEK